MPTHFDQLSDRLLDLNAINATLAMMDWDQQCFMPHGGSEARARQTSRLSRMAHDLFVSDETQRLLGGAEKEVAPGTENAAIVRLARRSMDLQTKLSSELVSKKARLSAEGHAAWVVARENNDFPSFAPILEQLFDLAREEAECIGYKDDIYDALLDQYEEGATADDCRRMFETLRAPMVDLVRRISESPNQPDNSFFHGDWNSANQLTLATKIATAVGYDFERGRIDAAPHPFCTGWSVGDIRITTRFLSDLMSSVYSTLHESGHAMYEQGSPMRWDGTMLAGGVSLGVHESQSRLWENIVGRSRAFVTYLAPVLKETFPSLSGITEDQIYRGINKVTPSFIRVEADEVTYNLHVMIRFEIESEILKGSLKVKDLPEAWNAKYTEYLGITPPTNTVGCLQDVHWAGGAIGYFPTYSMGNLLSYQIWNCLIKDVPNSDDLIASGNFQPILDWLRAKVYSKGQMLPPKELVMQVTGKPIGAEDYIAGLTKKYEDVYQLN